MPSRGRCLSLLEKCRNLKQLKQAHSQAIQCGLGSNSFALSRLLAFCSDPLHGSLSYASKLYHQTPNPTPCICNTMIKALLLHGQLTQTVHIYTQMLRSGTNPDSYTFPYLFKACADLGDCYLGEMIHGCSLKLGLSFDVFVCNRLMKMYAVFGYMKSARQTFDEMPTRTPVAWTIVISAFANRGDIDTARLLFDEAPTSEKDVGVWGSMISGYVQNNCFKEGLHMFRLMQSSGLVPDELIFVSILCACANLGALETGIWIHRQVEHRSLAMSVPLGTALIDMYAKCGNSDLSKRVFDIMPRRDTICWNAMIFGMAMNGDGEGALELFWKMENVGVMVDDLTFLAVFTACSYSGMAYEGLRVLDSMYGVHNIEPKSEHYGCIINFLGCAGLFEEAKQIIGRIPPGSSTFEEAVAWRAFLSACCNHGHIDLAEAAAGKLLQLEQHSGAYVLLSNMYAAKGKHEDARHVRRMMRNRRVEKMPGCSSVKVSGVIHEFVAGEKTHPQLEQIHGVLDKMSKHLDH